MYNTMMHHLYIAYWPLILLGAVYCNTDPIIFKSGKESCDKKFENHSPKSSLFFS